MHEGRRGGKRNQQKVDFNSRLLLLRWRLPVVSLSEALFWMSRVAKFCLIISSRSPPEQQKRPTEGDGQPGRLNCRVTLLADSSGNGRPPEEPHSGPEETVASSDPTSGAPHSRTFQATRILSRPCSVRCFGQEHERCGRRKNPLPWSRSPFSNREC